MRIGPCPGRRGRHPGRVAPSPISATAGNTGLRNGLKPPIQRVDRQPHEAMNFLVTDDDPVQRTLLARMIEQLGHSADVARDGSEAIACARVKDYDVVLLDIHMPATNGYDAARTICSAKPRPYVAMLTADTEATSRTASLVAGADAVLTKPVRLDTLRELVSSAETVSCAAEVSVPAILEHRSDPGPADLDEYAVLDLEALRAFRDLMGADDPDFIHELESDFTADARTLADSIERLGDRGDLTSMARAAHTLKSNAAMFGAMRLSSLARSLERQADTGLPYPWRPALGRLRIEIDLVVQVLSSGS